MSDRFTERARKAMFLAREEAAGLRHGHVGTEHVLLGILREGTGTGVSLLSELGVEPAKIRQEAEKRAAGGPAAQVRGKRPLAPGAAKALDLAFEEMSFLGSPAVGTEHLLLGLLREREGVAAQVLAGFGLTVEALRRAIQGRPDGGLSPPKDGGEFSGPSARREAFEEDSPFDGFPGLFRFSERSQRVLKIASGEAVRLRHGYVGTGHLLLAIAEEGTGVAAAVLANLGAVRERIRAEVGNLAPAGAGAAPGRAPSFSPRAKAALGASLAEAHAFGRRHIGAEHLLLGLLREPNGVAARILEALGLRPGGVRGEILDWMGPRAPGAKAPGEDRGPSPPGPPASSPASAPPRPAPAPVKASDVASLLRSARSQGLRLRALEAEMRKLQEALDGLRRGLSNLSTVLDLPFSADAKMLLSQAIDESRRAGAARIEAAHLMLALLRDPDGPAGRALRDLGVDVEKLRERIRPPRDGPKA